MEPEDDLLVTWRVVKCHLKNSFLVEDHIVDAKVTCNNAVPVVSPVST